MGTLALHKVNETIRRIDYAELLGDLPGFDKAPAAGPRDPAAPTRQTAV
ncbi:MAG: hypothetical protein ACK55X_00440 [Synechococcaceae cyanobacterium]|jgi:hypothetical protein